jgi:ribonuclease R
LLQEKGDIPIPRDALGGALSGDLVEVVLRKGRSEMIGRVVKVLERKRTSFVGELVKSPAGVVLKPDDPRVYLDFLIVGSSGAPIGHKAIVDIVEWDASPPKAKVRTVVGPAGEHDTEMRAIVAGRGFEIDFPKEVLNEAETLHKKWTSDVHFSNRKDFRKVPTFTIDPENAKDFDDAISYRELPDDSIEIGIHIADVTHFVRPGSALDREALKRATSVYLVDRTIPMLPPQLSEDLCSLKPDVDRLTFSAIFTVQHGKITNRWFGKSIIRSSKRFTYDEADEAIRDPKDIFHATLAALWAYASALRKERAEQGAVMFGTDEVRPVLDDKGEVVSFKRTVYTESHQLIEELMLLANREVAGLVSKRLGKKNRLFVYRIHDVPNAEKLDELAVFLRAIGYQLSISKNGPSQKDLNRILAETKGKPEERLIATATVRSMAKAVYTTKNIGHYGLAFDDYAHFTSPIRRYPDIMVHRTLATILAGKPVTEKPELIEQKAVHASAREVDAAEAERASVKLKQVEFFAKLIGQTRKGVVSGVTEWGIYIEDKETGAEGMVRLTTLTDDTYQHDPKKFAVVGAKTKRMIRLGDPASFTVERVDLEGRTIDVRLGSLKN